MKRMNLRCFALLLVLLLSTSLLASCSAAPSGDGGGLNDLAPSVGTSGDLENSENSDDKNTNESVQDGFRENPFVSTEDAPVSTFSSDVDTASYAYFRKLIENGEYPCDVETAGALVQDICYHNAARYFGL